jgi:ABC-type Fe3+/spermidine/putrescine transport system ATPase subunit
LSKLQLYVRPEDVKLSRRGPAPMASRAIVINEGQIVDALYVGGAIEYVVRAKDVVFYTTMRGSNIAFQPGDTVQLTFPHDEILVYADGRLLDSRTHGRVSGCAATVA